MTTTSEFIASASDRVHELGSLFYFVPETVQVGKEHGVDGFRFYVLGRAGVLGDVEPPGVGSAFGYWNPALVERIWNSARERCDLTPRETARLYLDCAADYGRRMWSTVPGIEAYADALATVLAAANPAGLHLFSGYVDEPLAADAPGRASQLTTILREHMGSAHLVAILAVGLDPRIAHATRRPDMYAFFGWEGEPPATTETAFELLDAADALTQTLITPAWSVLDAAEQGAVQTALVAMERAVAPVATA